MGYIEELRAVVGNRPLILIGIKVLLFDEARRVLLHQRPDGTWALPGGLMELGESAEDTGRREVLEETGLRVGAMDLIGEMSGRDEWRKLRNGDEFFGVTLVYAAREYEGDLRTDGVESVAFRWFDPEEMPIRSRDRILELLQP